MRLCAHVAAMPHLISIGYAWRRHSLHLWRHFDQRAAPPAPQRLGHNSAFDNADIPTMTRTLLPAFVLLLALPAATATAQGVYKHVDSKGNVTYTDKPPANAANVERLDTPAGPSDEAQREAQERARRDKEQANQMGGAREQRVQQQRAAQPPAPAPSPEKREAPSNEVQAYPDPNPLFPHGSFPDGPGRRQPPNRPAQLPGNLPGTN